MFGIVSGFILSSFGFEMEQRMTNKRLSFPSALAAFPIAFMKKLRSDRSVLFYLFAFLCLTRSIDFGVEFTTGCLVSQLFLSTEKSKVAKVIMFIEPINEIDIISTTLETLSKHGYLQSDISTVSKRGGIPTSTDSGDNS